MTSPACAFCVSSYLPMVIAVTITVSSKSCRIVPSPPIWVLPSGFVIGDTFNPRPKVYRRGFGEFQCKTGFSAAALST